MIREFTKVDKVFGELFLPGDKSISHRAIMFSSLAEGKSEITNCLLSEDVITTINAFRELGCNIEIKEDKIIVYGKGFKKFSKPNKPLYMGNSGTTTRLLTGILAAQDFQVELSGDESLSKRPMERIIKPLTLMGANVNSKNYKLPIFIHPPNNLNNIEYRLPIASAQVKSAILLLGIHINEETCVIEEIPTRNHTEKMLNLKVIEEKGFRKIYSSQKNYPKNFNFKVPSDISTASFFIVLTLLSRNSELRIKNVSLNETRIGIIDVLKMMGGNIKIESLIVESGEKRGDIVVRSSELQNIDIPHNIIPNIIDEIPILTVAGIFAKGNFSISNATELRYKESDRINSMIFNLKLLGLEIDERTDGFSINGEIKYNSAIFESFYDHRIAMAFSIFSSVFNGQFSIKDFECVAISNPNFINQLKSISV